MSRIVRFAPLCPLWELSQEVSQELSLEIKPGSIRFDAPPGQGPPAQFSLRYAPQTLPRRTCGLLEGSEACLASAGGCIPLPGTGTDQQRRAYRPVQPLVRPQSLPKQHRRRRGGQQHLVGCSVGQEKAFLPGSTSSCLPSALSCTRPVGPNNGSPPNTIASPVPSLRTHSASRRTKPTRSSNPNSGFPLTHY